MHPVKKFVLSISMVGLVAGVGACGDDDPGPCETASVTVTPATATIDIGATQQLTAEALDASGSACGTVAWLSLDATVATVDANGLVTGVAAGTADVTATAGGITGTSATTVNAPDAAPTITMTAPVGGTAVAPGDVVTIEWTATDDNGVTGVDLSYTADGVLVPEVIAADVQGMTYDWTTPNETLYGVVIEGVAKDASGQTAEDVTDGLLAVIQFSARGYVTSAGCVDCHATAYSEVFDQSGHPYKLNKVEGGVAPTYPNSVVPNPPDGITWNDVTYVIGGYGWKARFLDLDGYIYTPVAGANQWNLLPETWTDYNPDGLQTHPYNCGSCHTTGWLDSDDGDASNNQDGLAGLVGTFEEQGISCEQCHGPGVDHVATQSTADITVDVTPELCGSCHNRGGANAEIPASGGFIKHHEQYNEWANSGAHFAGAADCATCHDSHVGTLYDNGGFITTCETCHADKVDNLNHGFGTSPFPVECIDCHMPRASKSAVPAADNTIYEGDIQTHIFRINSAAVGKDAFFTPDLSAVVTPSEGVTLDFVCYKCHTDEGGVEGGGMSTQTLADLSAKAMGIHTP